MNTLICLTFRRPVCYNIFMDYGVELVGKIGSMALVDERYGDLDYNKFARISRFLKPGMVWVTSGATVIGKLDYIKRNGHALTGATDENNTDYSAQGQAILMDTYRRFIDPVYSVRQLLLEHQHFNNPKSLEHIKQFLLRCKDQAAIPIINYNDPVSSEENRKLEIGQLKSNGINAVELVDNDETAAQVACLLRAKTLLLLTNKDGIYRDLGDPGSLIRRIGGKTADEVISGIDEAKKACKGASRAGANGAGAKLEYIKPCVRQGTRVIIANAAHDIEDILSGAAPSTLIAADE